MKAQDQLYGHISMEIIFELEDSDIAFDFIPDFRMPNHSDQTKVQWQFQHDADQEYMDDVFFKFQAEEPILKSRLSLEDLRLLFRYNP